MEALKGSEPPRRGWSCFGSDLSVAPRVRDVKPCAFCHRAIVPGAARICNTCGLAFHVVHYRRHRVEWPCGDSDSSDDDRPPGLRNDIASAETSCQRAERWSDSGYAFAEPIARESVHERFSKYSYYDQRWVSFVRRMLGIKPPVRRGRNSGYNKKKNRLIEQAIHDAVEAASVPTSEIWCQPCDSVEPCGYCYEPITHAFQEIHCNDCGYVFHTWHYRRHKWEWPCGEPPPTSWENAVGAASVATLSRMQLVKFLHCIK